MMLGYYNDINCFTDASVINDNGVYTCSAGYAIVSNGVIIESNNRILYDATNSYGELFAIYMGIKALSKYRYERKIMNVFSDSRISIMGLREWIFKWVMNFNNSTGSKGLISYSGKEIANQELYTTIVDTIISNGLPIGLYHILGHINPKYPLKVHKARTYFNKSNGQVSIDDNIAYNLCYYNNYIDMMTRERLKDVYYSTEFDKDMYRKKIFPLMQIPMSSDLELYKELIS